MLLPPEEKVHGKLGVADYTTTLCHILEANAKQSEVIGFFTYSGQGL